VHPDILGSKCPGEYKSINDKSIQEMNAYLECLDKGGNYENKTIKFYVEVNESEEKSNFPEIEIKLTEIKQQAVQSSRITTQMK
jgi:hypothetical protein